MKKWLSKRNLVILGIVLVVAWWGWGKTHPKASKTGSGQEYTVVRKDVVSSVAGSGKTVAEKEAKLTFVTGGKLGFITVKEGDRVKAGQWLMGLNTGDLEAAAGKAYYTYLAADANAKQIEDEVKGHDKDETFVQKNERVAAQTARDAAYDGWLTARRAVGYATLTAPFDGVAVGITSNVVGDTVGVTDGLTVVDPSKLYFETEVDETDVGRVYVGQDVEVSLDAFAGEKIAGKIASLGFVSRISSSGATVYPVRVDLPVEWLAKLRLGMNGDAAIILKKVANVLALPSDAIVNGEVTLAGKEAKKVAVKTGLVGDMDTQILEGVNEGDKVVVK